MREDIQKEDPLSLRQLHKYFGDETSTRSNPQGPLHQTNPLPDSFASQVGSLCQGEPLHWALVDHLQCLRPRMKDKAMTLLENPEPNDHINHHTHPTAKIFLRPPIRMNVPCVSGYEAAIQIAWIGVATRDFAIDRLLLILAPNGIVWRPLYVWVLEGTGRMSLN